mgnify:CR=1 FL=1
MKPEIKNFDMKVRPNQLSVKRLLSHFQLKALENYCFYHRGFVYKIQMLFDNLNIFWSKLFLTSSFARFFDEAHTRAEVES